MRGHEDEGKTRASVDWASLAKLDGTIVCYAGPQQVPHMLAALLAHGRGPDESAALVYDGTLPTQETVQGRSTNSPSTPNNRPTAGRPSWSSGGSSALRDHLRWFDSRPLFGKRVLITRPREQAEEFVQLVEAAEPTPSKRR